MDHAHYGDPQRTEPAYQCCSRGTTAASVIAQGEFKGQSEFRGITGGLPRSTRS
jgi:hypothetical protein